MQDIYRKLPDPPAPTVVAEALPQELADPPAPLAPKAASDVLPESEFDQRELYEQLKDQFEPRQAADEIETPIERYKRLSRQAAEEPADERLEPPAKFGARESPRSPSAQPQPSLSEAPRAVEPRPARSRPSSPFQPRLPGGLSGDLDPLGPSQPAYRPVQSPFGQRAPAPTGFGVQPQPANPFGPQPAPRTVRQQPPPSSNSRYSNPAVRPDNPRDFIP